jgi:type IV pilus assembly protein PilA
VLLKNPAQILEDAEDIASATNSNAFAAVPAMEQMLGIRLKEDLLSLLAGELTVELDDVTPPQPVWKAILGVKDADHLQQTLSTLLASAHVAAERVEDGGVTYSMIRVPSAKTATEIAYAFVDGYLVIASSRQTAAEAIRLHRSGESLGKSQKFLASLPPGHASGASALLYEDPIAMTTLRLRQVAPGMAGTLAQLASESAPAVACAYGEETAIRGASTSPTLDAGVVLVVAAIAIPNLLRSRIAANEATAVGSLRTVNTAQVAYAATYPQRGYAPDLATLGPNPRGPNVYTADHAGFIDETLANKSCTADAWCTKSGYHFRVTAVCKQKLCSEYVATATPVESNTGTRSFCSTSDGVIRFQMGPPLTSPLSVSECKAWQPLQ